MELIKKMKIGVAIYGFILVLSSIWFYITYRVITKSIPFPPITSIVVWIGFIAMLLLMFNKERVKVIFGKQQDELRRNILHLLGVIFTAFILMITLLWSLSSLEVHQNILYYQSFILVGLFFYFVGSFYCILADL